MSSPAVPSTPGSSTPRSTISYQQRSGRQREERTEAMVVAAAERVMVDLIERYPGGTALADLSITAVCAASTGYVRRNGSVGAVPKATMWKHFKTVDALAMAVAEAMTVRNVPVPDEIATLARPVDASASPTHRSAADAERLEMRFAGQRLDAAAVERQYRAARARGDSSDMLFWSAELAERLLRRCRRTDRKRAVAARERALHGIDLVDLRSRLDCMAGLRCTVAAARAETLLSADPDYEATGLSRIRSIKETERQFADALGWPVRRAVAAFHGDRARALCEEDPRRELRAARTVAESLVVLCGPDATVEQPMQDALGADDLAEIVAVLCELSHAYDGHPEFGREYRAVFGNDMADLQSALLACFAATTDGRDRFEADTHALLRLDDVTRQVQRAGLLTNPGALSVVLADYSESSVDLLRTSGFGPLRDVLTARFLTAKAVALGADTAVRRGGELESLPLNPAALLDSAARFHRHAGRRWGRRGAAGILRERAIAAAADLADRYPVDDAPGDADGLGDLVGNINDLVLLAMSRANRLSTDEVRTLLDMAEPLYYYIRSGRG